MGFHVGQKVVCVNGRWTHPCASLVRDLPRKGAVYHVRDIEGPDIGSIDCDFIRLIELRNPIASGMIKEPSFAARNFRPVIERKTDISIFTRMLTPNKELIER